MTELTERPYLPAMAHRGLLPLYDVFARLAGARPVQRRLVAQAGIAPGHTVLEIGAGTGTVLLMAKRASPSATVTGLDPDAAALAVATRRAARAGLALRLDHGYADELPHADGSVDRVLSAFMFHHLPRSEKAGALAEVRRVLRFGGSIHLADIGGNEPGPVARLLHRRHDHDHRHGHGVRPEVARADEVLALLAEAGLTDPEITGRRRTRVGPVTFYRGGR